MGKIYHENICGIDVSFFSDESEEYTQAIMSNAKRKMKELLDGSQTMTPPRAAVIACLELCDELEKEKNNTEKLSEKIEELTKKLDRAVVDRAEAETKSAMLKQEVLDLSIKLSDLKG